MNRDFVKYLESLEQNTNNIPLDCYRCAYRDKHVNMCWYTVATHKAKHPTVQYKCTHFVPESIVEI